jgi:predicted O-methyltransferase YrrM
MATSSITFTPTLYQYYAAHAYREPDVLKDLRVETAALGGSAAMQIAPEQGAFMGMMAALMAARNILEFGTFTGYSSLAMALATQAHLTCVDVSEEWTAIARTYWRRAGVDGRITLNLEGGKAAIAKLLAEGKAGHFDLCFIDADKPGYDAYYEGALQLLRSGGLVMVDNVLWGGEVANLEKQDGDTNTIRTLNVKIKSDDRVEVCMLPIGDGLTLARKK